MPKVNREQLLTVLETVQPGLSPKDVIQQSSCFVFRDGHVITFNDEVSCRTASGLDPSIVGAVAADPLLKVLRHLKDDELDVAVGATELTVRGKRKQVDVRMEAEIVLPVELVEKPGKWHWLPEDFADAVAAVQDTAGKNEEEFMTVCLHLHPNHIEACDRFEACRYTLDLPIQEPFLVRRNSIKHIVQLGMTKISESESWVHLKNPAGLYFSCRRHVEPYLNLSPHFEFRGTPTVLPSSAEDAAKLAAIFSSEDKDDDKVMVELTEGWMRVRGEGSFGRAHQDLKMAYHGKPLEFRISPTLLVDLVTKHKDCEIGPDRLRIEGERWVYMTSLGKPRKPDGKHATGDERSEAVAVGGDGDEETR